MLPTTNVVGVTVVVLNAEMKLFEDIFTLASQPAAVEAVGVVENVDVADIVLFAPKLKDTAFTDVVVVDPVPPDVTAIGVAVHVPVVTAPKDVSEDPVTVLFSVAPVNVPAAAVTVVFAPDAKTTAFTDVVVDIPPKPDKV